MVLNANVQEPGPDAPADDLPVPPISSRFLFVDVAAQRAKQLRRGALPRLEHAAAVPHKLERVAMDEVRSGLIAYTVPGGFDGPSRGIRE